MTPAQSMDMRYWVKKFYKDASDWNDSISRLAGRIGGSRSLANAENWYVMDKDEESALELKHGDWEMDSPFQLGDFWVP